jgi:hypothetical protein
MTAQVRRHLGRRRGRPRKPRLPLVPLGHSVKEYAARTSRSPATIWRRMRAGRLKYVQDAPGTPRKIPMSQYIAEGYCSTVDELVEFLKVDLHRERITANKDVSENER